MLNDLFFLYLKEIGVNAVNAVNAVKKEAPK